MNDIDLLKELKELKKKYDNLKSSYDRDMSARIITEEKLIKRSELLSDISQYSIDLREQSNDNISSYITKRFKELFNVRAVWYSTYDEINSCLIIEDSTLTETENSEVVKFIGNRLEHKRIKVDDETYKLIVDSGIKIYSSLHEVTFGQIPRLPSKAIAKLFNAGWFLGVALVENGILFGTMVIAGNKGQDTLEYDIVKIFAELTSNILRKKHAESKLQASEDKFRKAFITSPDSININQLDNGKYVSINLGFTKIMGYTEDEVIGKTSLELNIWENPADRQRLVKELTESGEVTNLEARFVMKNGSVKHGMMSATIIHLNGIPHIISITRDITDRKISEELIRKSEEKYRLLAENISDVIWILDTETLRFLYCSPSVERLRGYTSEEIIGKPVSDALTTEAADYLTSLIKERANAILTGKASEGHFFTNEVEQPCKDGTFVWTEVVTSYYINKENGHVEVLGVTRDISARKQAEEALRESEIKAEVAQQLNSEGEIMRVNAGLEKRVAERTSQLEAANRELEAFAYSVSHDLRAPLRAIDGFSRFVLEDYGPKLDDEGKRLLGLIRSNTQKMDKLITDILALSRVTRSQHKISKIDMAKMAVSMFHEAAAPEVIEKLSLSVGDLPETYADPTYIKQVWLNLFFNAVKFSSLKEKPEIHINGYREDGFNIYCVSDNGVGFNQEYAHKLFGVFQRLHRSDEFEGNGVGLAIVQRIIHRHGGEVWAEGAEGKGATFYFSLPVPN